MAYLYIFFGGGLGALCRACINKNITFQTYPLATLFVNIVGSILLGIFFYKYAENNTLLYALLGVGFCGGFTTFSTFSLEVVKMFQLQQNLQAIIYIFSSLIISVLGIFLGLYLGKKLL